MRTPSIETIVLVVGMVLVIALCARLFFKLKRLEAAFPKLGYALREDAKKYFEDASQVMKDTNAEFRESYVAIVEEGTRAALNQTGRAMEGSILASQQEANKILLRARDDARRINVEARKLATSEMARSLESAADTIAWVMERYVGETFTIGEHRQVIESLVNEYINEYRN